MDPWTCYYESIALSLSLLSDIAQFCDRFVRSFIPICTHYLWTRSQSLALLASQCAVRVCKPSGYGWRLHLRRKTQNKDCIFGENKQSKYSIDQAVLQITVWSHYQTINVLLNTDNRHKLHLWGCDMGVSFWSSKSDPGLILGLRPVNERRRYFATTSLIGWAQT